MVGEEREGKEQQSRVSWVMHAIAHVILGFQKTHHYHKNMQIRKVGGKRGLVVSNSACVGVPGPAVSSKGRVQWSVDRSDDHGRARGGAGGAAYGRGRPRHTEA